MQPPSQNETGKICEQAIRVRLANAPVQPRIFLYDSIDSTNTQAKRLIADGERAPLLVVANGQTAGRGRLGRSFYSPASTGVYMTLVLDALESSADTLRLTTCAAVAVVLAVEALTTARPKIKWVNDVFLNERKICGILAEAITDAAAGAITHVAIGIGVNVSTDDFPEALSAVAASLHAPELSRERLIAAIAEPLLDSRLLRTFSKTMDCYRAHSLVIGKTVWYRQPAGEFIQAKALAVDDEGGLVVQHAAGSQSVLRTGEVTLRIGPAHPDGGADAGASSPMRQAQSFPDRGE